MIISISIQRHHRKTIQAIKIIITEKIIIITTKEV